MHFSQEAFKGTHFKIKAEQSIHLDDIKPGCSAGDDSVFCQNNDEFMAFDQLCQIQETDNGFKTLKYFFPDVNQIESRFNDTANLTHNVEKNLPTSSKLVIESILEQVKTLSPVEKMLLYLKLPTGKEIPDPLKQPLNPLGSRPEISQTIAWIKTHLEEDKETSIPKQDVYNEYLEYSSENGIKPLSTADFGKVMKQVYPNVRPRRLGTRGNSRYCYSGMTCRTELPTPTLPRLSSGGSEEGGRTCAWAAQVLGTPISSLTELEAHLASRGLPTNSTPVITPSFNDDAAYIMSSKISKSIESKQFESESKRKVEEDSSLSNRTPPERCKGKKRSNGKKTNEGKKKLEEEVKRSKGIETDTQKHPVSRLVRQQKTEQLPQLPRKQQKCLLQNKEQPFLENGNSLEQEEELLRYFQSGSDEPKVSQLRLLLERKEDKSQVRRRVSFETVPESPKKFSFVPISPVSPFVQPQRVLHRSSSVNSPVGKGQKKAPVPVKQEERSQSVPMSLPQDTPVPSETIDFGIDTDSSNLLIIDESSESLLIDSGMNNDNLNAIFSIISEMETRSRSYPNTPTYRSLQSSNVPSTSFFDDLDCDVTLGNLSTDVNELGSDVQ